MANFHYLGKNGFPHGENIDVYKYNNDYDYNKYNYSQMTIQVCSVPWDNGEAHIGQRTIEGIGNTVFFKDEKARDDWFNAIPDDQCFRWETRYKELHSDMTLNVPLPFDVASNYNYVRVTYNLFANDTDHISYESDNNNRSWFYFIRKADFLAPNTTQLTLLDDVWQTWIYKLNISNMILERGHAPLFRTKTDDYLKNPIENCSDLLAEDVNYGELQKVTKSQVTGLNTGDLLAVIVTSACPWLDFGTKSANTWNTPDGTYSDAGGAPNFNLIALNAVDLNKFLDVVQNQAPQFIQTIQTIFFIGKQFVNLGTTFDFVGYHLFRILRTNTTRQEIFTRTKNDWHYDKKYVNLAKLYTYPYSALEITDEKGNVNIVHIEDTSNVLTMDTTANIVFPYLNISGIISGIGGNASASVTFQNIEQRTFNASGEWYKYLREWKIPGFLVTISAAKDYDYKSHFDRLQMDNDRNTARSIANRNASNAQSIAIASANTTSSNTQNVANAGYNAAARQALSTHTQANNNASNVLNNATAQTTANSAINSNSNSTASSDAMLQNELATAIQRWDAGMTTETTNNEVDAKNASATVGAAGGVVNSAASGVASGATGGPAGMIAGAVGGLISGGINAATSLATNQIAVSAMEAQATAVNNNSASKLSETNRNNTDRTNNANTGKTNNTNATNKSIITTANNSAGTININADNQYDASIYEADTTRNATIAAAQATQATATNNANSTYNTEVANATDEYNNTGNRINNRIKQAALDAPKIYGSVSDAEFSTNRPMALYVNIVTENDHAISRAGDEFLRYGYEYDKQYDFNGNWNIGKHFTFWKLRDYWSTNQIPDVFGDQLRLLLMGGVTVWNDPNDIGKVTIYDNGI